MNKGALSLGLSSQLLFTSMQLFLRTRVCWSHLVISLLSLSFLLSLLVTFLFLLGLLRLGFPGSSAVKKLPVNTGDAGDVGSIPGSERFPGEGNGYPLQYSCLENPKHRGVWWATVHWVAKSCTQLSNYHLYFSSVMFFTILELSERNHTFEFFTGYRHL